VPLDRLHSSRLLLEHLTFICKPQGLRAEPACINRHQEVKVPLAVRVVWDRDKQASSINLADLSYITRDPIIRALFLDLVCQGSPSSPLISSGKLLEAF
jgi:hypothetical protein